MAYCGECPFFKHEDTYGYGICDIIGIESNCSLVCAFDKQGELTDRQAVTDFVSDPPNGTNNKTLCMCVMEDIAMVIPYNDKTKHLVGTDDEAPEYYRYWED